MTYCATFNVRSFGGGGGPCGGLRHDDAVSDTAAPKTIRSKCLRMRTSTPALASNSKVVEKPVSHGSDGAGLVLQLANRVSVFIDVERARWNPGARDEEG